MENGKLQFAGHDKLPIWDDAENKSLLASASNHTPVNDHIPAPPVTGYTPNNENINHLQENLDPSLDYSAYQFLEPKFFKIEKPEFKTSNINDNHMCFLCQLCTSSVKVSCNQIDDLRNHISNHHEAMLNEFDHMCRLKNTNQEYSEPSSSADQINMNGVVRLISSKGPANLGFNFHGILEETLHTDVTFHFCDGKLALHRLVLEAASPYLKHIFRPETFTWEQDIYVSLPDFSISDMQPILPFLYGFAEDSTQAEGELVNCLWLGRGEGERMKKEIDNWNVHIKKEYETDAQNVGGVGIENLRNLDEYNSTMNVDVEPSYFVPSYLEYDCDEEWQPEKNVKLKKVKKPKTKAKKVKGVKVKKEIEEVMDTFERPEKKGRKLRYIEVENGWKCTICDTVLDQRHKFRHHADSCFDLDEEGFKCGACKEYFKSIVLLKEHLKYNKECTLTDVTPTLICEECPKPHLFYNVRKFEAHSLRHQSIIQCNDCDARYEDYREYVKHIRMAHNDRQYPCTQCCKSFALESVLEKHVLNCHKEFSCHVCGRKYKSNPALKYHMRKHDKGPFSCPKCPRVLKSEHGLAYHMNIHNGTASFMCSDCGRSFVTKQKMQNHVRAKHTHERPYICDQCGAGFIRSDKMLIHKRRVHTGERPYACEHCEWRGVDSSDLIHHRKKHLKAFLPPNPPREIVS